MTVVMEGMTTNFHAQVREGGEVPDVLPEVVGSGGH